VSLAIKIEIRVPRIVNRINLVNLIDQPTMENPDSLTWSNRFWEISPDNRGIVHPLVFARINVIAR
jgi:hypothetical protein